jgi:DNA repair protein RecN (Recombination protein N)
MLEHLAIRNFAIISGLEIRLRSGLNILSGETGAGKSIIVNAVNLILGGRASADLIRTGTDEARVEALFTLPEESPLGDVMAELDVPFGGEVLITRTISREGRNAVRINGALATLQMLSRISPYLISVSGQHEHQRLLRPENHLLLLDDFGGLEGERTALAERFALYSRTRNRLTALDRQIREMEERRDLAGVQAEEIRSAGIEPGEDERLEEERVRLRHAEELRSAVGGAYLGLYERDGAVISEVARCEQDLERAARLDRRIEPARQALLSAQAELEEAALQLRELRDRLPLDPNRLEEVEERIQLLRRLKRKYGPTLEEVLGTGERLERQMDDLEEKRKERERLQADVDAAAEDLLSRALDLSERRREAAGRMGEAVERELSLLAMAGTRFEVRFEAEPDSGADPASVLGRMGPEGIDRVEFLLSPNVGEAIRPMARIASGGELSRIMLALKTILAGNASVETVVFDEVDAGIGGGTAETVGEKLRLLSRYHQILCITHLPQIASKGSVHFQVSKGVQDQRTEASITELDPEDRVREIARLLGGRQISRKALDHAREMLEQAPAGITASPGSPDPPESAPR